MSDQIDLKPIQSKLGSGGPVLVLFGENATLDHVASALALYLSLKKQGKDLTIASPAQMRAEFSRLIGLDAITNSISNRDLVIGFNNYDFSSIEKVSHNEGSGNRFELIIQPKTGKKAPNPKQVDFTFRGASAELIFTVGVSKLEDLGSVYESERSLFSKATLVAFNRKENPNFAAISAVDQEASSFSEIVFQFIEKMGLEISEEVATNLFSGLDFATNRFQNPMIAPSAFMTAGRLLQLGAKRQPPRLTPPAGFAPQNGFMPFVPPSSVNQPPQPFPQSPTPNGGQKQNPPQDWLKPKIYKGGTRV